jgi:hypothetical protein
MSGTVSFLTNGDEPPQSLTVTKAALYGSGVFRTMLDIGSSSPTPSSSSSPAGTDAEPVPLSEKAVELVPFFEILEGKTAELKMEEWPEEAWESLARLADKYDGGEARALVKAKIWCASPSHSLGSCSHLVCRELIANDSSHLLSFTLSTLLHDTLLIERTAVAATYFHHLRPRNVRFGASQEMRERLVRPLFSPSRAFPY